jgi:hypothetical protein
LFFIYHYYHCYFQNCQLFQTLPLHMIQRLITLFLKTRHTVRCIYSSMFVAFPCVFCLENCKSFIDVHISWRLSEDTSISFTISNRIYSPSIMFL